MLSLPLVLVAQDPIRLEYTCPPADIERFGLTCSEDEPCEVFLELASADAVGSTIFAAGNLHTVNTTLYVGPLADMAGGVGQ